MKRINPINLIFCEKCNGKRKASARTYLTKDNRNKIVRICNTCGTDFADIFQFNKNLSREINN